MQTAKLEEVGKINLHFPERNCSSALHTHRMVMGSGENIKSGSWPVVVHSPYVVEALMFRAKDLQEHHVTRII
jgi:hypothetical protein